VLSEGEEAQLPLSAAARSREVALVKERQAQLHFLAAEFRSSQAAFEEQTKAFPPAFEAQAALAEGRRGKSPLFQEELRSRKNAPEVKASARVQAVPADLMVLA
jgi:hypothetical protein